MASSLLRPSSSPLPTVCILLLLLLVSPPLSESSSSPSVLPSSLSAKKLCNSTPHPETCLKSLNLFVGINISPSILTFLLQTLKSALSEASDLARILGSAGAGVVENQRATLQDCWELHQISLSCLRKSSSFVLSGKKLSDVRTFLSAALTNRATCLEGLAAASGPAKETVAGAVAEAYKSVSNALSILSNVAPPPGGRRRGRRHPPGSISGSSQFPAWLSRRDRRLLQSTDEGNGYDPRSVLTVAQDGSGNFTTIGDAVAAVPNNSGDRTVIIVRAGVYNENVEIPSYKTNVVFLGDGSNATVIRGSRSVGGGWTTFRSATLAVAGEGFLARDIAVENVAGPENAQAVALRVNADLSAFYLCSFSGYQDTLYVHSFRQFYRECAISGTVDFIFGNAAVVFQGCAIQPRRPLPGQFNAITAQGRDDPNENTGISIQNCTVVAAGDFAGSATRTYLGRPWREYSRTVFMETYMDSVVDPAGWREWNATRKGLETVYYGEYRNRGEGARTEKRVDWAGHHLMEYDDAVEFTVEALISGDGWLESTSFPYDYAV